MIFLDFMGICFFITISLPTLARFSGVLPSTQPGWGATLNIYKMQVLGLTLLHNLTLVCWEVGKSSNSSSGCSCRHSVKFCCTLTNV